MSDPLSVAASVLGMVGLCADALTTGYRIYQYCGGVQAAPDDVASLVNELEMLLPLLCKIRDLAMTNPRLESVQTFIRKDNTLDEFKKMLEGITKALNNRLGKWKGGKGKLDRLKWPLHENRFSKQISQISRIKQTFNLALSLDTASSADKILEVSQNIDACVQLLLMEARNHVELQDAVLQVIGKSLVETKAEEKRKAVLTWLSPGDFNKKHEAISNDRQEGTGAWLLMGPEFQNWRAGRSSSRFLVGYGIAGAGKTYLSSAVIDHFRNERETTSNGIAYIYFTYSDSGNQHWPPRILRSLIKQLIVLQAGDLPLVPSIIKLYEDYSKTRESPTDKQLYAALIEITKSFSNVFFVFDALDECYPRARSDVLALFQKMSNDGINIFATSRPLPDIQRLTQTATVITLSAKEQDMQTYLHDKIAKVGPAQAKLLKDYKDRVVSEIVACSGEMFLLARFYFEFVCAQYNPKRLKNALRSLRSSPDGAKALDLCYHRVIESIKGNRATAELAISVLAWLVKAKRPLKIRELQEALAVEPGVYELDEENVTDEEFLVDVCEGLVEIDERSGTFIFTHATVQEYLADPSRSIFSERADLDIAIACTTYLSFDTFATGPCDCDTSFNNRLESHPFLPYAAFYLSDHLLESKSPTDLPVDMLFRFLGNRDSIDSYIQVLQNRSQSDRHWFCCARGYRSLHVASMIGYTEAIQRLTERREELLATDSRGQQPLHLAAANGHTDAVQVLLGKGADPSSTDNLGQTPLYLAARQGSLEVTRLLLNHKVNPSVAETMDQKTPLHAAARKGYLEIVKLLLDHGANPLSVCNDGLTPLSEAARNGHGDVVQWLLAWSADPSNELAPVHCAAVCGHRSAVQLVLDRRSSASYGDRDGKSLLHCAAKFGQEEVVKLLLDQGANPMDVDQYGLTPLHSAAYGGHTQVAQLLIDRGASPLIADNNGRTPLHSAAEWGYCRVAQLLLKAGASPSHQDNRGRTPLELAKCRHQREPEKYREVSELFHRQGNEQVPLEPTVTPKMTSTPGSPDPWPPKQQLGHQAATESVVLQLGEENEVLDS